MRVAQQYFVLMVQRMTLTEQESRILQRAYGAADDYEPDAAMEMSDDKFRVAGQV